MIPGSTLNIDGKDIYCPSAPLYVVKSGGYVVDISLDHYAAETSFDNLGMYDRELWCLSTKGHWGLLRRMHNGKEV